MKIQSKAPYIPPLFAPRFPGTIPRPDEQREFLASFIAHWWVTLAAVLGGIILSAAGMPLEGGAIAVLGFAPLYWHLDRRYFSSILVGPCTTIYLFHLAGYCLGPLAQRYIINIERFVESGMIMAQWGAVIGLATFAIIYPLFYRKRDWQGTSEELIGVCDTDSARWKRYTLAMLVVFVIQVLFGFISGATRRLGTTADVTVGVQSLFSALIDIRTVIWFFLGFGAVRFGRRWALVCAATLALFSSYTVLDGSRGPAVFAVLFTAIGAASAGFSRRNLVLLLVGFAIVFSPIAAIVSTEYRVFYQGEDLSFIDRATEFTQAAQDYVQVSGTDLADSIAVVLWQSTAHTVDRIFFLTPVAVPFIGLADMGRLVYMYLPRLIAPDRPSLQDGSDIACTYAVAVGEFAAGDPRCGKGDYTPTVGEGYRRLGWPGIPLLYALQAVIFGFALSYAWEKSGRVEWVAVFVLFLYLAQSAWSNTLNSTFYMLGWVIPRDMIVFWGLGKLADLFTRDRVSIHR
jgi:hypothetical protein